MGVQNNTTTHGQIFTKLAGDFTLEGLSPDESLLTYDIFSQPFFLFDCANN